MVKQFSYECRTLASWSETNPQQALLKMLRHMVTTLMRMEDDGSLKEMLCELPVPHWDPFWVENAARCANAAFRADGLGEADKVLTSISKMSVNSKVWNGMARLGEVRGSVAIAFERHLWVMLVNYSFKRASGIPRVGRQPKIFIREAVDLLKGYVHGGTSIGDCPHCTLVARRFDDLANSPAETRH